MNKEKLIIKIERNGEEVKRELYIDGLSNYEVVGILHKLIIDIFDGKFDKNKEV